MNQKINFQELVDLIARKQQCSKRDAEMFLRELMSLMTDVISEGEILKINSLGTFKPVWVEERASVNVQTGEPYVIPGHYKLTFTPVKAVRDAMNEPFSCFVAEVLPDEAPILISGSEAVDEMTDNKVEDVADTLPDDESIVTNEVETVDVGNTAPDEAEPHTDDSKDDTEMSQSPTSPIVNDVADDKPLPEADGDDDKEDNTVEVKEADSDVTGNENNDVKEKISRTYRRGLWTGITVATAICTLVVLSLYLYLKRDNGYVMTDSPEDTIHAISEEADTVALLQDTIGIDSINEQPDIVNDAIAAVATLQVDTIRSGVFLTSMSLRHYGHKAFWVYIYEENKDVISNPDLIPIGTAVVIPPPEKYGINSSDTASVNKALTIADEIKARKKR